MAHTQKRKGGPAPTAAIPSHQNNRLGDAANSPSAPPSLANLARALDFNVDNIFEWVYSNVDFYPMWGLHKGALGALVDKLGGSFEQANLMVSLLQMSGYSSNFAFGSIRLTAADVEQLLGTDDSTVQTSSIDMLNAGQIPNTPTYDGSGNLQYVDISHVWVQVNIDGTDCVFDPSYKTYAYTDGIDIASIIGYDEPTLISAAEAGATITADSITNLNSGNVNSSFTTYGTNLLAWIQSNNFSASMKDIIGGRDIQLLPPGPVRQTSLPNQTPGTTPTFSGSIPSDDLATLRLQMSGIDMTFNSADIYAGRLTLTFDGTYRPILTLNGVLQATGTAYSVDTFADVTITITHPFSADTFNQTWTQQVYVVSGSLYLLSNAWGPGSQSMADYHRWVMQYNKASGSADSDEDVLGESLAALFSMNSAQRSQLQNIYDQLGSSTHLVYHLAGVTGYNSLLQSPYFDFGGIQTAVQSRVGDSDTAQNVLLASDFSGDGFAAGILQQATLGTCINAGTMLDAGNTGGQTIYDANSSNWTTISAALSNWTAYLPTIGTLIAAGYRIIIQENGDTTVGSFGGGGYYRILSGLSGQLTGGISSTSSQLSGGTSSAPLTYLSTNSAVASSPNATNTNNSEPISADQVGLCSGTYYQKNSDITVGSGKFPYSLEFLRSYSSGDSFKDGPLGPGWNHNFNSYVSTGSNGLRICGEFSPKEASAAIAHAYAMIQLALNDSPTLTELLIASESTRWLMLQMASNAVKVSDGSNSREYVLLVDGSTYNPIPGYCDTLTESGGLFTLQNPQQQVWSFNSSGYIDTFTDPAALTNQGSACTLLFTYDSGTGLLQTISNGLGRSISLVYAGSRISTVSSSDSRSVSFAYDSNGNLISFTGLSSRTTSYGYAALPGILTSIVLPIALNNAEIYSTAPIPVLSTSYDSNLLVMNQIGSDTGKYTFNFAGSRTEVIDPNGNSFVRYRNSLGSVIKEVNELGQETLFNRDGLERITSITYPELNQLLLTYDNNSNVLTRTWQPKPGSGLSNIEETFTYDPTWNRLASFKDSQGNTTSYSYDSSQGTLLQITRPTIDSSTPSVLFTYNSAGQVLTRTDETSIVDKYNYVAGTELLATVTHDYGSGRLNLETTYGFDTAGNLSSLKDPRGNTTHFSYNNSRQLTFKNDPSPFSSGATWEYDYNSRLSLLQFFDGTGNYQGWNYTYLNNGLLQSVTDPAGNAINFSYDSLGRLAQRIDAEEHSYSFVYDELSRIASIIDASITIMDDRTYTDNGMLASRKDASGNQTTFLYDGFDRLSTQTFPDTTIEQYSYDNNDNVLTIVTRNSDTITNTYDALNRLSTRWPDGLEQQTLTYDLAGRLTGISTAVSIGDPGSGPFGFAYDTAGRLYEQSMPDSSTVTYQLDGNGNRTQLTWPDGYYASYQYDSLNRLVDINLNGGASPAVQIACDGFSRRTNLTYDNGCSCTYSYALNNDLKWQLQLFTDESAGFGYSYNSVHQLTALYLNDDAYRFEPATPGQEVYSTANSLNQYPAVGGTSYSYDNNGCLTSGLINATFDTLNRMTQASNGVATNDYLYDPLNRQAQKTSDGNITNYLYDGQELIATYDSNGTLLKRFVRSDRLDEVLISIDGSGNTYLHQDRIGSVIAESNSAGAVVSKFAYSSFGESTNSSSTGFGFTGQRYDPEIGIYFSKARYYAPAIGRFLQPDPLGYDSGELNLYTYVNNDPLNRVDRLGLSPWENGKIRPSSLFGFDGAFQYNLSQQSRIWTNSNPISVPTISTLPQALGQGMPRVVPANLGEHPQSGSFKPLASTGTAAKFAPLVVNASAQLPPSPKAASVVVPRPSNGSQAFLAQLQQLWFSHPVDSPIPGISAERNYCNLLWVVQNNLLPRLATNQY